MGTIETKEANNKLQIFKNEDFGEVRTIQHENKIWFIAKDICDVLGLSNPTKALQSLETDERTNFKLGRQGETNFINESGLYALILKSRKTEAKKFRKWITSDVLPQIRKYGMYATNELLDNPDLAIQVFQELKQEREKRKQLEAKQEQDKPLLDFAECITSSDDCISVGTLAKLLTENGFEIGQNRLFDYLRNNKYLYRRGNDNLPMQRYVEQGLFKIIENKYTDSLR